MLGGDWGAPRLTRLINVRRFPSFLLFLSGKKFGELHRQFPEAFGVIFRKGSSRRYATRILEVTELSSFQFVLVPFLVSPNSDSQVSQLTNRAYAYQLSVDRWWFCEMLTYARAKPASTADLSRSERHSGGGRPVSYWCVA
jgi:hypothetical protein